MLFAGCSCQQGSLAAEYKIYVIYEYYHPTFTTLAVLVFCTLRPVKKRQKYVKDVNEPFLPRVTYPFRLRLRAFCVSMRQGAQLMSS
jgi:hypothetical protein